MVKLTQWVVALAISLGASGCLKKELAQDAARPGASASEPSATGTNQTEPKPTSEHGS